MSAVIESRDIPISWQLVPLKELGVWSGGGTPSKAKPEFWTNGSIPWVSPKDMKTERIIDSEDHITKAAVMESTAKLIPEGSVLVVTRSGILSHTLPVAITTVPVTVNQDLKAITPKDGVLPEYVAWALRCFARKILNTCSKQGTTVASIETAALHRFEIPLAPLDQQKRIVAEIEKQFSRLDEAVANLKRVKANLKRYKAAVLKAAVEGRLVETDAELARREGRSYETGAQLLQRILETRRSQWQGKGKYKEPAAPDTTALPELPDGWVWATVDQLAVVGTGATPARGNQQYYDGGDIPWVTSGVVNQAYIDSASEFVTPKALAETNLTLYPTGTLLVAMYGEGKTRGKCAELRISATTNQALAALQADADVRNFLRLFLEHNYEETRKVALGGVQPNLNLSLVRSIQVPIPPLPEQHRITSEVDRHLSLLREIEAQVDANLQRAQTLRQAVLAQSFSLNPGRIGASHG
ncbi:MAG TPA: restriction endonuclease subunit S [Nitrospira sp.]|nr:restriction endonuclease subunit S [Nitrospira sp.]HNG03834.1 restriction endonuclease subunit S [Nitrospira sp.]HNM22602.1 restriction endonuclease subunit S [Rhodocyclaceae bacterium]